MHYKHFDGKHLFFFSLDVEGAELAILLTIPWDKVDIQVGSKYLGIRLIFRWVYNK